MNVNDYAVCHSAFMGKHNLVTIFLHNSFVYVSCQIYAMVLSPSPVLASGVCPSALHQCLCSVARHLDGGLNGYWLSLVLESERRARTFTCCVYCISDVPE